MPKKRPVLLKKNDSPKTNDPQSLMRFAGMGTELAAAIIGFAAIGYWVDRGFESFPRGTAIGAVLGIIGGMYNFLRESLQLMREQASQHRPTPTHAEQPEQTAPLEKTARPQRTDELLNTDDDQPDADA